MRTGSSSRATLTRALCAAAQRHGAQAHRADRVVRRIHPTDRNLEVETVHGSVTADAVVLAAGSWSGTIEIAGVEPRVPVRPVRGQLLHLDWKGAPLRRVTWSRRCYLVPWDDGIAAGRRDGRRRPASTSGRHGGRRTRSARGGLRRRAAGLVGRASARRACGLRPGRPTICRSSGPSAVVPGLDVRDRPLSQRRAARAADRGSWSPTRWSTIGSIRCSSRSARRGLGCSYLADETDHAR